MRDRLAERRPRPQSEAPEVPGILTTEQDPATARPQCVPGCICRLRQKVRDQGLAALGAGQRGVDGCSRVHAAIAEVA